MFEDPWVNSGESLSIEKICQMLKSHIVSSMKECNLINGRMWFNLDFGCASTEEQVKCEGELDERELEV